MLLPDRGRREAAKKDVHVQHASADAFIESLDEAVLHRAAWLDKIQSDVFSLGPLNEGQRDELRSVVQAKLGRVALIAANNWSQTFRHWSSSFWAIKYTPRPLLCLDQRAPMFRFSSLSSLEKRSPPLYSTTSSRPSVSWASRIQSSKLSINGGPRRAA